MKHNNILAKQENQHVRRSRKKLIASTFQFNGN